MPKREKLIRIFDHDNLVVCDLPASWPVTSQLRVDALRGFVVLHNAEVEARRGLGPRTLAAALDLYGEGATVFARVENVVIETRSKGAAEPAPLWWRVTIVGPTPKKKRMKRRRS